MAERIEDYALLGDLQTAALVGRTGRSTGLLPTFDSRAVFGRCSAAASTAAGCSRRGGGPATSGATATTR